MNKVPWGVVLVFMLAGSFLYYTFGGVCVSGESEPRRCVRESVEGYVVKQKICDGGRWIDSTVEACEKGEYCSYGVCLSDKVGGSRACASDYSVVVQDIVGDERSVSLVLCEEDYYCSGGKCVQGSPTCGDGFCVGTEDIISCPKDCDQLTEWDAYHKAVVERPQLRDYLACTDDFNCGSEKIEALSREIVEAYDAGSPREYIDAVVEYVHQFEYDVGGGFAQCGESATDILEHAGEYGINCVDYSVLTITLLRQMGIPAIQEIGCISKRGWSCQTYSFIESSNLERLGHISTRASPYGDMPLGHSWMRAWTPEAGWLLLDPTVGQSISKNCVGYYPTDVSSDSMKCYVSGYEVIVECRP